MTRLALAALAAVALALAAASCGPSPSGLSPDAAFEAALDAVEAGDVPRALALLDEAADAGHLAALEYRADSYRTGTLRTGYGQGYRRGVLDARHAFLVLPGQADAAARAYRDALASAAEHDTDARFQLAHQLAEPTWTDGRHDSPPAELDSARVLYSRLRAQNADPYRLAMLAWALRDTTERDRQMDLAARAGNSHACWFRLWTGERRSLATVAGFSDYVDDAEACAIDAEAADPVADGLRALVEQSRAGNGASVALLDSLRADGLFDRHPRLATVVAGAVR